MAARRRRGVGIGRGGGSLPGHEGVLSRGRHVRRGQRCQHPDGETRETGEDENEDGEAKEAPDGSRAGHDRLLKDPRRRGLEWPIAPRDGPHADSRRPAGACAEERIREHDFRHGRRAAGRPYTRRHDTARPTGGTRRGGPGHRDGGHRRRHLPVPSAGEARAVEPAAGNPMRWVALLTCFAAAVPMLLRLARDPELLARPRSLLWLAVLLAFVSMFWAPALRRSTDCRSVRTLGWLVLHSLLALALLYAAPNGLYGVYLVVAAASVGEILPLRAAFPWVGVQTLAALPPFLTLGTWYDAVVYLGAFAGFQLFAAYAAHVAERERRGREQLAAANAELTATRRLLAVTSRNAERLRIARDLHDVMGHHLAALSLQLEAARHAAPGEVGGHVEIARQVAATLLTEVRQVVSTLRETEAARSEEGDGEEPGADGPEAEEPGADDSGADGSGADGSGADGSGADGSGADDLDTDDLGGWRAAAPLAASEAGDGGLAAILATVGHGVETPRIELSVADDLRHWRDPEAAGALLRCTQEVITNAVRHARAQILRIDVGTRDGGVELVARDDGVGAEEPGQATGHGLVGMRERLERLGGRLTIETRPGAGFAVRAWLPRRAAR